MNITLNPAPVKKLMAALGSGSRGLFVRGEEGKGTIFISEGGNVVYVNKSLEDTLKESCDRTAIYEGDAITIQF